VTLRVRPFVELIRATPDELPYRSKEKKEGDIMKRWFILLAIAGGMVGCADESLGDDEGTETLQQAIDGAVVTPTTGVDAGTSSPATSIGGACMADSDCAAPAIKCQKLVEIPFGGLSIAFAGGYCTKPCTADAECGAGAACPLSQAAAFLPEISSCLKQCTQPTDCREGYSCGALPAFPGFGGAAPAAPAGPAAKHCLPPRPFPGAR
jgi:hypothetical protein